MSGLILINEITLVSNKMNLRSFTLRFIMTSAILCGTASTANAALYDRGSGLIYDDVLNVTWLQDANFAKTSGYDSDGSLTWGQAREWASTLIYAGYDDWRLAKNSPINGSYWDYSRSYDGISSDRTFNIISPNSELGYMYYVNLALFGELSPSETFQPNFGIFGTGSYEYGGQANVGLIKNLQSGVYWSDTELSNNPYVQPASNYAWWFATHNGSQTFAYKGANASAWAVRDGDVTPPSAVPLPATLPLMLSGLGILGFAARLRKSATV